MDLKGFEAINQTLAAADIEATVTPQPREGEDVRYVTIETNPRVPSAAVLNALGAQGLMQTDGPQAIAPMSRQPELAVVCAQPDSLTFEDNRVNQGMWG